MGFCVCFSVKIKSYFTWFYPLPFSLGSVPEKYHCSGQSQEQPYLRSSRLHSFYNWDHPRHPTTFWDTCVQLVLAKFLITLASRDVLTTSVTEKPFFPVNTRDRIDILPFWIKPVLYFFTCNQNLKPDTSLTKYVCPTGPKLSSSSHTCKNF